METHEALKKVSDVALVAMGARELLLHQETLSQEGRFRNYGIFVVYELMLRLLDAQLNCVGTCVESVARHMDGQKQQVKTLREENKILKAKLEQFNEFRQSDNNG